MKLAGAFIALTLGFASLFPTPSRSQIIYEADPVVEWDVRVQSIREGNGVFLSPDESLLVTSTNLGYVSGFGPLDGSEVFSYLYTPGGQEFVKSYSGISFGSEYLVYSVTLNEDSPTPST